MSEVQEGLKYAKSHEWIRDEGDGVVTIGITAHAQELLGDMVFIELPEVETTVTAENECAVVESVKAASDVYAPVNGEVMEVNSALEDKPELVNQDCYGDGWLFRIMPGDIADVDALMSADAYAAGIVEAE